MEAGHHGADRDIENLRGVLVAEVADVHEDDDVAEVVRYGRERVDDRILREALDDALLVFAARLGLEAVVEEVVAFLERLVVGRALLRRPRSMLRFVRIRKSQARRLVPGV